MTPRTVAVIVRLRPNERAALKKHARAAGLTVADYIRRRLGLEEVERGDG